MACMRLGGERERLLGGERERLLGGERERLLGGERERLLGGEREFLCIGISFFEGDSCLEGPLHNMALELRTSLSSVKVEQNRT